MFNTAAVLVTKQAEVHTSPYWPWGRSPDRYHSKIWPEVLETMNNSHSLANGDTIRETTGRRLLQIQKGIQAPNSYVGAHAPIDFRWSLGPKKGVRCPRGCMSTSQQQIAQPHCQGNELYLPASSPERWCWGCSTGASCTVTRTWAFGMFERDGWGFPGCTYPLDLRLTCTEQ